MRKAFLAIAFMVLVPCSTLAQGTAPAPVKAQAAPAAPSTAAPSAMPSGGNKVDNDFVRQQFGDQFTYVPEVGAAIGDLDGDGVEDIVIAARCKNPLLDQAEHHFKVVDPYYDFFGYGDPKLTTTFSEGDPARRGLVALIIHGAGKDAWRSATPKAKYVIVNLPYRTLSVRKMDLGKKTIEALYVEEAGDTGESSAVFFDRKHFRYRYIPMGGDMQ